LTKKKVTIKIQGPHHSPWGHNLILLVFFGNKAELFQWGVKKSAAKKQSCGRNFEGFFAHTSGTYFFKVEI